MPGKRVQKQLVDFWEQGIKLKKEKRAVSSVGEHLPYKQGVGGSNPPPPI